MAKMLEQQLPFMDIPITHASENRSGHASLMVSAALEYIAQGFALMPGYSPLMFPKVAIRNAKIRYWFRMTGKVPLRTRFMFRPLKSRQDVRNCFEKFPLANLLVVTGRPSGVVVLDVDDYLGGNAAFASMNVPVTRSVSTGDGKHYYFLLPEHMALYTQEIMPGVTLLAEWGRVALPPSLHANGKTYAWDDLNVPIAPFPESLRPLIKNQLRVVSYHYSLFTFYLRKRFLAFPILRFLLWWEGIRF